MDISKITSEAFGCIANIGSGRHNGGDRGTMELSANVLGPLAEIMRDIDWESPQASQEKLAAIFEQYPDVLEGYPALKAFVMEREMQLQH